MKTIVFQGDSITDCMRNRENNGYGGGYAQRVVGHLSAYEPYKYTFYNRGISGNRVVDIYARMRRDIINLSPDIMSILVGVNDVSMIMPKMMASACRSLKRSTQ